MTLENSNASDLEQGSSALPRLCTEIYTGQGLGNQLWAFCAVKSIAHTHGFKFEIFGREKFKGKSFIPLDFNDDGYLDFEGSTGPNEVLPEGISNYVREFYEVIADTKIDVTRTDPAVLSPKPNTKIDGNFQSLDYLVDKQIIQSWFPTLRRIEPSREDICVIHIRGGDFKNLSHVALGRHYYAHCVDYILKINPSVKFRVVTDDPEYAKSIVPIGLDVVGFPDGLTEDPHKASHHLGGPVEHDFLALYSAKYLIIPNSSFSWWAAFLNPHADVILAPKFWARNNISDGFWSPSSIITPGFTYIDKNGEAFGAQECAAEKDQFYSKSNNLIIQSAPPKVKQIVIMKDLIYLYSKKALQRAFRKR